MCATCHVYVDPAWADKLPAPLANELEMLECTAAERRPDQPAVVPDQARPPRCRAWWCASRSGSSKRWPRRRRKAAAGRERPPQSRRPRTLRAGLPDLDRQQAVARRVAALPERLRRRHRDLALPGAAGHPRLDLGAAGLARSSAWTRPRSAAASRACSRAAWSTIGLDADDGRLRIATLTKKGRELHDQILGIALERERAFLSVLERRRGRDADRPAASACTRTCRRSRPPPRVTSTQRFPKRPRRRARRRRREMTMNEHRTDRDRRRRPCRRAAVRRRWPTPAWARACTWCATRPSCPTSARRCPRPS